MPREIRTEDLPPEIRKDAPYIADGFLNEIDALEESAERAETEKSEAERPSEDIRSKGN